MLGIYCRISQDKEEGENKSIRNQKDLGIDMATKLGLSYQIYIDEGISGTIADIHGRPGLSELVGDISSKKLSAVFVTDQSRLERNPRVAYALKDIFLKHGTRLYDTTGEIDQKDPQVDFISNITSIINEFYVKNTQRKIKEVLKQKVKQGKIHGIVPYGFNSDDKGFMIIDDEESKIVLRVYELSLNGIGTDRIAKILNKEGIPTRYNKYGQGTLTIVDRYNKKLKKTINKSEIKWAGKTVQGMIKNTVYYGERTFSGDIYSCPKIMSKSFWEKVNLNLSKNKNNKGKIVEHKYMLKGIIKCGRCGRNMYGRTRVNKKDNYYMCSSKRYPSENCGVRSINIDIIENFIWQQFFQNDILLNSLKEYFSQFDDKKEELQEKVKQLNKELNKFLIERSNAVRLVLKGVLKEDDVVLELKRIDGAKVDIEIRKDKFLEELQTLDNSENILENVKNSTDLAKNTNVSWNDRRNLIRTHIEKIKIYFDDDLLHYMIQVQLKHDPMNRIYYVMDWLKREPYIDLVKTLEIQTNSIRNGKLIDKKVSDNPS